MVGFEKFTENMQRRSQDVGGYESDIIKPEDWAKIYGDEYGNNLTYGDTSMLKMVQGGNREATFPLVNHEAAQGEAAIVPETMDRDPWASRAQAGMMHAHVGEKGCMSKSQVDEFDEASKGKHLPEHVKE